VAVVVTGAAGFIGAAVLRELTVGSPRTAVVAVDRRPVTGAPAGVACRTGDLLDGDLAVTAALREAEAVIHLAGCPSVRAAGPDIEARRRRDNVGAAARVLAAVPPHVPLVVASSSSVYGGSAAGRPCAETDPLRPVGGYARSKAAVERLCARRAAAGGLVVVARPFTVAGEGQRPDMALARWIDAARCGRPVSVFGSLARRRDVTDVRQVAAALVALTRLGREATGPVNIGTGRSVRLGELLDAVADAVGVRPAVRLLPAAAEEVSATLADTGRLRGLLGWAPVTDLPDVVRRQAAAQPTRAKPPGDCDVRQPSGPARPAERHSRQVEVGGLAVPA